MIKFSVMTFKIPLNLVILLVLISQRHINSQSSSPNQVPEPIEASSPESMSQGTGILDNGDCGPMEIATATKLPGWPKVVEYAKSRWGSGELIHLNILR
jgi:hypothetical protein